MKAIGWALCALAALFVVATGASLVSVAPGLSGDNDAVALSASLLGTFGPGTAQAVDYETCCRLGNPGCCFRVIMELWWEGQVEFPY